VIYPVAVIKATKNPGAARQYEGFLSSHEAAAVFQKYGFNLAGR